MIGLPTNFQHCAHIGCSDIMATALPANSSPLNNAGFFDIHNFHNNNNNNVNTKNNNTNNVGQPFVSHMKLIDLKTS